MPEAGGRESGIAAREERRANIQAGIYTGYGTAAFFGGVAWYAAAHGFIPPSPGFAALVVVKLTTNTLSWITLRARVAHLAFASLNIAADLLAMTGAVYLTGGPHSPLLSIYFIEVAVMALLTNVDPTIVTILASRAEAAQIDLAVAPVAVGEVVDRVAATGRWMRGRKELAIEGIDVHPPAPRPALGAACRTGMTTDAQEPDSHANPDKPRPHLPP